MDLAKFSHNYKLGAIESNVIFDSVNYMPREVILATTLDAFNTEILEVLYHQICQIFYTSNPGSIHAYLTIYSLRFLLTVIAIVDWS